MLAGLSNVAAYFRYSELLPSQRRIVIYSEGRDSWPHLGPLIKSLLDMYDGGLAYVCSCSDDPGLTIKNPRLNCFVIGEGLIRTIFFNQLHADVVLMTMPDLNKYHIRRSPKTKLYVYLHHSMVSSHMAYREGAFDSFDVIFCTGPHHEHEIRTIEITRNKPQKKLIKHGYGRLDTILAERNPDTKTSQRPTVLVAPSWGPEGMFEKNLDALLEGLANLEWNSILRPHPQTRKYSANAVKKIRTWCSIRPTYRTLDEDVTNHESLSVANVMVTDWSGAAFDFALGLERPVLYVEIARKINNPEYRTFNLEPIEVFSRHHLGHVIQPEELRQLPVHLENLLLKKNIFTQSIRSFRDKWVFNIEHSGEVGARALMQLLEK